MRQGRTAQRFVGDVGERIDIRVEPLGVGNTFTVSQAAPQIDGGETDASAATFRHVVGGAAGNLQSIILKFRFAEPVPSGGFPAATWPRFGLTLSGSHGGQIKLPSVLQSSVAPVPSSQELELLIETAAAAAVARERVLAAEPARAAAPQPKPRRRKPARKKAGKKKGGKKKAARKKAGRKKTARKKKPSPRKRTARRRGKP